MENFSNKVAFEVCVSVIVCYRLKKAENRGNRWDV